MPINASRFKPVYAWLSAAVIVVALIIIFFLPTEPVIRLTGLVLQLLGIGTVIWGISETRALFGHPSFRSKARDWLSRFPLFRRHVAVHVLGSGAFSAGGASVKAVAYLTHGPEANTIEARLEALEKNVKSIHERINTVQKEMDKEFQRTADALKREEQSRQEEERVIREKLEATGTGGVHISFIGALLLFVGIILSTAAIEIAKLLN